MFTITTTIHDGKVTAKGKGKQRTVAVDSHRGTKANHGMAAGVLANLLMTSDQQAKVQHPSGAQRYTYTESDRWTAKHTIDV